MKRVIYLILLSLVACSDTAEVAKETDLMLKEMEAATNKVSRENAQFWQNVYLKLDIALEKYKKADPEAIEFTKEVRNVFESIDDDFSDKHETRSGNIIGRFSSYVDRLIELNSHRKQLEAKMCAKYQIQCKANSPAAPEKK